MANRVIIGKVGSDFGIKVSKPGIDVTTGADKDMLFHSTSVRTGLVYAGGAGLSLGDSAQNFLTTGSKASLGYPPLVIFSEKNNGEIDAVDGDVSLYVSERSLWSTTTSTVTPVTAQSGAVDGSNVLQGVNPSDGRGYGLSSSVLSSSEENALDVSFFVLRIPCAFGYMNSTYFG